VVSLLSHFWLGGSLEGFLAFGVVACFYFLILINAYNPSRVRVVCITIVVCALVMSVQGMLAYHTGYLGDDLLHVSTQGTTVVKRVRAFGILKDANDLAQFLVLALAMLGVFWNKQRPTRSAIVVSLPAAILIYAIYLTGSRGAMVGLAVIT